eukprot:gene3065-3348_t
MILPFIGRKGQELLQSTKVLLIGAGGIGSSTALYLAGAGIPLTIMDHDQIDISNLHRQIIHDSVNTGMNKALSAINRLYALNPNGHFQAITERLTCSNALTLISNHDIIVDGTDNFETRYILNDACLLANKPLITGSAVGLEGQITVIIPRETPCYRCLYPQPSIMESCRNCANAGVLGPVPGLIGCLEAMETIKLIVSGRCISGNQLFYDGWMGDFTSYQLPPKTSTCAICGTNPSIHSMEDTDKFLQAFIEKVQCASKDYLGELKEEDEVSPKDFSQQYHQNDDQPYIILDVRSKVQFDIITLNLPGLLVFRDLPTALASLAKSGIEKEGEGPCQRQSSRRILINIPLKELKAMLDVENSREEHKQQLLEMLRLVGELEVVHELDTVKKTKGKIFLLCRRGIDSTVATRLLIKELPQVGWSYYNVRGGLTAWQEEEDSTFPLY